MLRMICKSNPDSIVQRVLFYPETLSHLIWHKDKCLAIKFDSIHFRSDQFPSVSYEPVSLFPTVCGILDQQETCSETLEKRVYGILKDLCNLQKCLSHK